METKAPVSQAEKAPVAVYNTKSQLTSPRRLFRSMWQDLKGSRELGWRLFVRDISAQYRQSLLGIFWAFLPPIATGIVFIILQSKKVINFGETDIPYPVFVLIGTTLWQVFTESLNAPLRLVRAAKPMLARINFPREALLLSALYQILFNFFIKALILAGIFIFFKVHLTWGLLWAPLGIFMLILLGLTLGLFLTPVGLLYNDIQSSLTVIMQLWFFLTPVVYPPPQSFPFSLIAKFNPVSPILVGTRDLMTKGALANLEAFLIPGILALIALFISWIMYRIALPIIIERMSA